MKNIKYVVSIFVIGLVIGSGGVYLLTQQNNTAEIYKIREFTGESAGEESVGEGVLYTSDQYGFSFHYPKGLIYKEFNEGEGSQTIVFQKPGDAKLSFQIYITPYNASTITGERILQDIPSGNVNDLKEEQLTKDLRVATFTSKDQILGETKEIWFIDGEYLYQATTFVNLDTWLIEMISTWSFNTI